MLGGGFYLPSVFARLRRVTWPSGAYVWHSTADTSVACILSYQEIVWFCVAMLNRAGDHDFEKAKNIQ